MLALAFPNLSTTAISAAFNIAVSLGIVLAFLKSFKDRSADNMQRATNSWRELYESEQAKNNEYREQITTLHNDIAALRQQIDDTEMRFRTERQALVDAVRAANKKVDDLTRQLNLPAQ